MHHARELRATSSRGRDEKAGPGCGWLAALLPLAVAAGCGGVPQELDDETTQGALLTCSAPGCKEFTDPTGTIKTRVRTCGWVTASGTAGSQTAVATCGVDGDAGYVLVGGGAEIENSPTPGALLKSSIPDPASLTQTAGGGNFYYTRWLARSSEYGSTNSTAHRVRAYSIAMRLVGMSATETANNLLWADGTDSTPGVAYTQVVPEVNVFLGGGATVLPYTAAMYLVMSEPNGSTGWLVDAHVKGTGADPSPPKAYAVSISPDPVRANGTVWGHLVGKTGGTMASASGVYVTATYTETDPNFVVTSVGGHGYSFPSQTVRRFLTDIIPGTSAQSSTIWAKSTGVSTSGGAVPAVLAVSR